MGSFIFDVSVPFISAVPSRPAGLVSDLLGSVETTGEIAACVDILTPSITLY